MHKFLTQARKIVAAHKAQYQNVYYMVGVRDAIESAAVVAGNYYLPGSSLVTDNLVSKGAQKELSSPLGEVAQIGSGLAGGGALGSGLQSAGGALESSALSSIGNSLGITGDGGLLSSITGSPSAGNISATDLTEGEPSGTTGSAGASVSGAPATAPAAVASSGGTSAAATAAPASVDSGGSDVNALFNQAGQQSIGGTNLNSTSLNSVGSQIASSGAATPLSTNIGTGTTGTQGLSPTTGSTSYGSDIDSQFSQAFNGSAGGSTGGTSNVTGGATDSAGAATGGATGQNSLQKFLANPSFSSAGNILTSNPGALLAGAGLGVDALKQGQTLKGQNNISSIAGQEQQQGQQLETYLQNGTLPPGLQAGLAQASKAAEASIRSQYAARGMSGSSAEAQDLANLQSTVESQGAQMAMQLLNTGISETGMAAGLYQQIMNSALQKDQQLGSAISSFASAAAGGIPKIQVGNTTVG